MNDSVNKSETIANEKKTFAIHNFLSLKIKIFKFANNFQLTLDLICENSIFFDDKNTTQNKWMGVAV